MGFASSYLNLLRAVVKDVIEAFAFHRHSECSSILSYFEFFFKHKFAVLVEELFVVQIIPAESQNSVFLA